MVLMQRAREVAGAGSAPAVLIRRTGSPDGAARTVPIPTTFQPAVAALAAHVEHQLTEA
jgi:hypothetical protein